MASGSRVTGVAEIVLSVVDLPRMREFYKEVLGFELLSQACHTSVEPDPEGEPTIAFLTIRQTETPLGRNGHPELFVLIDYRRHVFAKTQFDGHEPRTSTLNHLAFEIPFERYEAERQRLEDLGLEPEPGVFDHMSARALFFWDPEGNRLELICHDPALK